MKVSDIGEFGLIERLVARLGGRTRPEVAVGPGDDAAVLRFGGEYLIATTDTMVEGVHFNARPGAWRDIGWKALATNLSDVAAMGGTPNFALVTLCLPPDTEVAAMDELYAGIAECAAPFDVIVAGGDVVRAPQVTITTAVLGRAEQTDGAPLLLLRSGARAGDAIAVTGTLGDSAGGLRRLREGADESDPLVRRHLRPQARVEEGQLAVASGIRCGIDVSDGLLQDVGHICKMSAVGAVIRAAAVPISDALRAAYPDDALELACTGGEDYELVLVGREEHLRAMQERSGQGAPVAIIGKIVDDPQGRVRLVDDTGGEIRYERPGWDAFK